MNDVLDAGEVGRRFQRLVDERSTEKLRVDDPRPLGGGYSRTTWVISARTPTGEERGFVVRADPQDDDGPFQSDRDEEWAVLTALSRADGVRIPDPIWYDPAEFFPTRTIVSEHVPGQSLQSFLATDAARDGRGAELLMHTLADIHATPVEGLPLAHPGSWQAYMDEVLDEARRFAHDASADLPILSDVVPWLVEHRPPAVPLTLVHGDFQPGNVLLGPDGPCVIDWEFARIGDPREDLGYYRNYPVPPNLYHQDAPALLALYREATGRAPHEVDERACEYFMIVGLLGLFRQIWECTDGIAAGTRRSVLGAYLINTLSHLNRMFHAVIRGHGFP